MKKKFLALALIGGVGLSSLTPLTSQSIAYASEKLDFGIDTANFPKKTVTKSLKQDESLKEETLRAVRDLRAKAWDENVPYTQDGSNSNNMKLRDYLKSVGISSKDAYLNSIGYSKDHEKIAIQRAFELDITDLSHQRPDGSSYGTAVLPNGSKPYAEIVAWNTRDFSPKLAVDQWSVLPRSNFDGKSEYDMLKESNGVYDNGNGHLHILLDPAYTSLGLAITNSNRNNFAVMNFGVDKKSGSDATGLVGEYTMAFGGASLDIKNDSLSDESIKKLKEAVDTNKRTIDAARFLIENAPETIKPVRAKLDSLMEKSEALIKKAEAILNNN